MARGKLLQLIGITAIMASLLACKPIVIVVTPTRPPAGPTLLPPETPAPQPTPVGLLPETPTPSPTLPPPTPTACTFGARLVADVTVPDNTAFAPGIPFVKTWRMRNSGTCAWIPGTQLVFVSGDPMGGPTAVDVPALAPGAQTDVSASFTAPTTPGTYRANYQLQAPDGTRFGSVIWVQIVVVPPATPTPTPPPPAPTPAPFISFTADRTSLTAGECTTLRWSVENVREVYLNGVGVVGHGTQNVCPASTTTYTLRVVKLDGSTEERMVTINVTPAGPIVLYNFADHMCEAVWRSGVGLSSSSLPCPGPDTDNRGFVRAVGGVQMEDGSTPSRAIETHPMWVNDGWIWGMFSLPTPIRTGDRFRAQIGFLRGASAGNVVFKVFAGIPGGPPSPLLVCAREKAYTGALVNFECTFQDWFNGSTTVYLRVEASGSSAQDWAVWIEPQLIR